MSALSGGSWLLSSLADHDFPTVSSLLASQWSETFSQGLLDPYGLLTAVAYAEIIGDFEAKEAAGFQTSISDIWARLLSWQLLNGYDGGVASTLSGITSKSAFISHSVPYPIITALNADVASGSCVPGANSSVWELTPYETGSWGAEINAFTPSKYLGTAVTNGKPNGTCINGFDNLGFVLGTSSNVFNDVGAVYASLGDVVSTICAASIGDTTSNNSILGDIISSLITIFPSVTAGLTDVVDALYALYPNPFYGLTTASQVSSLETLHMVDGGESGQTSPIFPHLLPARNVSLLIINDNNGDTNATLAYPNGTAIYNSYLAARAAGLTRMPTVPSPASYLANYTSGAPIFFGCQDPSKVTLVWVPNADVSYASGIATFSFAESAAVSSAMIENGAGVISRGNSKAWAECLGCAILDAGGLEVPGLCKACFEEYCYAG